MTSGRLLSTSGGSGARIRGPCSMAKCLRCRGVRSRPASRLQCTLTGRPPIVTAPILRVRFAVPPASRSSSHGACLRSPSQQYLFYDSVALSLLGFAVFLDADWHSHRGISALRLAPQPRID